MRLLEPIVGVVAERAACNRQHVLHRLGPTEKAGAQQGEGDRLAMILLGHLHARRVGIVEEVVAIRHDLLHPLRFRIKVGPDRVNDALEIAQIAGDGPTRLADGAAGLGRAGHYGQRTTRREERRPARGIYCAVDALSVNALVIRRVDNRIAAEFDDIALRDAERRAVRQREAGFDGGHCM